MICKTFIFYSNYPFCEINVSEKARERLYQFYSFKKVNQIFLSEVETKKTDTYYNVKVQHTLWKKTCLARKTFVNSFRVFNGPIPASFLFSSFKHYKIQ